MPHGTGVASFRLSKGETLPSQSPRGLRPGFAAACLLGLCARIRPETWISVFECCVLSSRILCFGPITHPEESYIVWHV
jgi:hypothetical protein